MITHLLIAFEDLLGPSIAPQVVPHWSKDISFERDKKNFSWEYMTNIVAVQLRNKKVYKPAPNIQSIHVVHPLIEKIIAKEDELSASNFALLFPRHQSGFLPLPDIDVQQF